MPRWLVEYDVEADIGLSSNENYLTYRPSDASFEIRIENFSKDSSSLSHLLSVQVLLEEDSHEKAAERSKDYLKLFLDTLSFATSAKFVNVGIAHVVDWSPGLEYRTCIKYKGVPSPDIPSPLLGNELIGAVEQLLQNPLAPRLRRAIRCFKLALAAKYTDEKFQYFWFVLEIVAEFLKEPTEVPDRCPHCRSALFCQKCQTTPQHRPFAKQAIMSLLQRIVTDTPEKAFDTLSKVRHALLHGGEASDIEKSIGVDLTEIVDKIGRIAKWAIREAFLPTLDIKTIKTLNRRNYNDMHIAAHLHLSVNLGENPARFNSKLIPEFKVSASRQP